MAAARQLAAVQPHARIVLIEANRAAEGASARNSGFLVDATLNEGTGTAADIETFKQKYRLNLAAIAEVKAQVERFGIDCDWDGAGKLYAARHPRYGEKLDRFAALLGELGMEHEVLGADALAARTGTAFYTMAVWTKTSVLLQPAKLARGLLDALPPAVDLFEGSPILAWASDTGGYRLTTPEGTLRARNVIMAVNGFMPELGIERNRSFALLLTASLSRPLTQAEYLRLGAPAPYGVLSADAMGATVRLTRDRRLLVRNTCEVPRDLSLDAEALAQRHRSNGRALAARFPTLDPAILTHHWSGIVSLSLNGHHVFGRLGEGLFVAGCYNANGIGTANLLGREIANLAAGQDSDLISLIKARSRPRALPPQPLLGWGARLRLMRDAWRGRSEQ
ncbi:glycine/D-amino acid oxidase-like deaminating enzyme [Angulomicrobium tetraedrale]|uniref:Glycine/D-amino acid oxidase-like deaminating enzyme n=2 Tax=Ancylobacter tetraedralis TaxID=217068 RepID=A0A839ZB12_9HYPH|nr:glycine/D-amino acid oxidase-like deaminating enzyme [Ancylobacter tetraedralis]